LIISIFRHQPLKIVGLAFGRRFFTHFITSV
jgi:hypothetical protein